MVAHAVTASASAAQRQSKFPLVLVEHRVWATVGTQGTSVKRANRLNFKIICSNFISRRRDARSGGEGV